MTWCGIQAFLFGVEQRGNRNGSIGEAFASASCDCVTLCVMPTEMVLGAAALPKGEPSSGRTASPSLAALANDVLLDILAYCNAQALSRLAQSCRLLYLLARESRYDVPSRRSCRGLKSLERDSWCVQFLRAVSRSILT
jgi:hypothetical protein